MITAIARRISETNPNCVSFNTVSSTSEDMESANGRTLIDDASSSSQIMPDAAAIARRIQATRRVCARTTMAAGLAEQEAASTTTVRNIRVPVVIAVAAKWIARTTINGPLTPAPNQSMGGPLRLLADLQRETAVGRMRVHRKHTPRHVVSSGAPGAQRYRHLVAADTGFSGIDALAGGVGHGDGAERRFQVLRKPKRHLARRGGDLVADARFGMIEKGMRSSAIRREQQQQWNYSGKS